jgi:hypothetical protein
VDDGEEELTEAWNRARFEIARTAQAKGHGLCPAGALPLVLSPATSKVVEVSPGKLIKVPVPRKPRSTAALDSSEHILAALIEHLGSRKAADAWLDSPDAGYPTTARDAIRAGRAEFVLRDLESRWGPTLTYG